MRRLLLLTLSIAAPAAAAETDWSQAQPVTVQLFSYDFTPDAIGLRAGVPVLLHLVNRSALGHDFSAPAFFAAARIEPSGAARIREPRIEVPPCSAIDVRFVPAARQYRLPSTHTSHSAFGMRGRIVVD